MVHRWEQFYEKGKDEKDELFVPLEQTHWSGFILQGIFLTQRWNLSLLPCGRILYHCSTRLN